jgi:hypothetical protein
MRKSRAAFFFGSGIAFASKGPCVTQITDSLLNDSWERHTSGRFIRARQATMFLPHQQVAANKAQEFLRVLKRHIDPHLREREQRQSNYEDLYFAALQIWEDLCGEYTNPLLSKSLTSIRKAAAGLCSGCATRMVDDDFAKLALSAADLTQWAVFQKVREVGDPVGLSVISEVAVTVGELDIFTLNHDLLVEAELKRQKMPFADGFACGRGKLRKFDGVWDKPERHVRLFKLHGSVDWYEFTFPKDHSNPGHRAFAAVEGDPDHCIGSSGEYLDLVNPQPMFLTGTAVKERRYGIGLIGAIFAKFFTRLAEHRTLICCGYGWGDKGMNIRLDEWLQARPGNRIVILQEKDLDKVQHSEFWASRWRRYRRAGKVKVVRKWLSACTAADVRPFFD